MPAFCSLSKDPILREAPLPFRDKRHRIRQGPLVAKEDGERPPFDVVKPGILWWRSKCPPMWVVSHVNEKCCPRKLDGTNYKGELILSSAERLVLVIICAALHPACGGTNSTGGVTSATLLSETWTSSPLPGGAGSQWAPTISGFTTVSINTGVGNPAPSVDFILQPVGNPSPPTAGAASASTVSNSTFHTLSLTFKTQMALTVGANGSSTAEFKVGDGVSNNAFVTWTATSGSSSTALQFTTQAGGGTPVTSSAAGPPADSTFHTFQLAIDATGKSTWSVDGAAQAPVAGWPSAMVSITLSGTGTSATGMSATHHTYFDNIGVTTP